VSSAQATATHDPAAYEHHRGYVLAVLARRCGWLADDEREAIFHDAYLVLLQKEACGDLETIEMHPHQLRAYIVQTAINKALDEGKRVERRRSEPIDEQVLAAPDAGPAPEELASASLDNARLREVVAGLAERQQTIVRSCPGAYVWMVMLPQFQHASNDYMRMVFRAPEDTVIRSYRVSRSVRVAGSYGYLFGEVYPSGELTIVDHCVPALGCTALGDPDHRDAPQNIVAGTRSGQSQLMFVGYCALGDSDPGACPAQPAGTPAVNFALARGDVTLQDDSPPAFALPPGGPLVSGRPLVGVQQAFISATDRGGGVYQALFEVDGRVVGSASLDPGNPQCRAPFSTPAPCARAASGAVSLDTRSLPDGRHSLRLLVADATGTNTAAWGPVSIEVANGTCNPRPRSRALRMSASLGRHGTRKLKTTGYGKRLRVRGRLATRDRRPLAGTAVCVVTRDSAPGSPLHVARVLTTDAAGRFAGRLPAGASRKVWLVHRVAQGAVSATVRVRVRAPVRLRAPRRTLHNGGTLRLRGRLPGRPIPRKGVLVALQALRPSGWQNFGTARSNREGRFAFRYLFSRTTGLQRYRIRARVPGQAAYPYAPGASRPVTVTVRG
jgi:DNA-directed RNA polymerase specialized sigma24 family protein